MLVGRRDQQAPLHGDVLARALEQLAARRRVVADEVGDLLVAEVEET